MLWLTLQVGKLPWISLVLAVSFALYGLIRKTVAVEPVVGLGVETALVVPLAAGWLLFEQVSGHGAFGHRGAGLDLLMIGSGLMTALPLALFAFSVQRIALSTVGLLQYLSPSLQLLGGVFVFGEPFSQTQLVGFGCIWAALVLYAIDGLLRSRTPATVTAPAVAAARPAEG